MRTLLFAIFPLTVLTCDTQCHAVSHGWFAIWFANMTALEENAIKVLRPDGRFEVFATAPEFLWPDTITISRDGDLLFSTSQFHLMPAFNGGVDKRKPPYNVFRLKLS